MCAATLSQDVGLSIFFFKFISEAIPQAIQFIFAASSVCK
jgi:hypothetical protein